MPVIKETVDRDVTEIEDSGRNRQERLFKKKKKKY